MTFVPLNIEDVLVALGPARCPYCLAYPEIPCVLHRPAEDDE